MYVAESQPLAQFYPPRSLALSTGRAHEHKQGWFAETSFPTLHEPCRERHQLNLQYLPSVVSISEFSSTHLAKSPSLNTVEALICRATSSTLAIVHALLGRVRKLHTLITADKSNCMTFEKSDKLNNLAVSYCPVPSAGSTQTSRTTSGSPSSSPQVDDTGFGRSSHTSGDWKSVRAEPAMRARDKEGSKGLIIIYPEPQRFAKGAWAVRSSMSLHSSMSLYSPSPF